MSIAFIDLQAQQRGIRERINHRIQTVLDHGAYIMGPEVAELESALSTYANVPHVISCANGTDALGMALMALNLQPKEVVFVPAFTFAATAEVVAWMGALPYSVDIDPDTFNISTASLEEALFECRQAGHHPVGIIPVDLFGQPADYAALHAIADREGLWILADAAQSFGATCGGAFVGSLSAISTTSFFPAKPLGCYGDGGAIFTHDENTAELLRSIRVHGQGKDKYQNVRIGINGRLDTLQAAILLEKLAIFPQEIQARQCVADHYDRALSQAVKTPQCASGNTSVWAQYTLTLPEECDRDALMQHLKDQGIPSVVYYPIPLHQQQAYAHFPRARSLTQCERLCHRVLSLPMHAYLTETQIECITGAVLSGLMQST